MIERFEPDVVCFDPLSCFGIDDLNRDSDMRATCQAIAQLSATGRDGKDGRLPRATVVLHHALTGRAGATRAIGIERSSFGRNSKLLQAWTRRQINLAPASAQDNSRLVLSCGKCSNGEEFEPFSVKLNPATMIYEAEPEFDHAATIFGSVSISRMACFAARVSGKSRLTLLSSCKARSGSFKRR